MTTYGRFITLFEGSMSCFVECSYLIDDKELVKEGFGYTFKVTGLYQNGKTETSSESVPIFACVAPSYFDAPQFVSATLSSISLSWKYPNDLGSCSISSFALYMNDGLGGDTFTEIDSAVVRDKPNYL